MKKFRNKGSRSTAFEDVKTALRIVEKAGDAFPPLKATAGGILGMIDICKATEDNIIQAKALETHLYALIDVLKAQPTATGVEDLVRSLDEEVAKVAKVKKRGHMSKIANAEKDAGDLASVLPMLSTRIELFIVENTLSMKPIVEKTLSLEEDNYLVKELDPVCRARYDRAPPTIPRGPCTPQTRVNILTEITEWVNTPTDPTIYCLNGMAGMGKTTIAYSLCESLDTNKRLAASFFCSRTEDAYSDAECIAPTIAYQIASHIPEFHNKLLGILRKPDCKHTFQNLVTEPLSAINISPHSRNIVVIDALDECRSENGTRMILKALGDAGPSFPIKFFVAFRPNPPQRAFIRKYDTALRKFHLHDVEQSFVKIRGGEASMPCFRS